MATKTAIVFAGGSSLGAVQVGMLRALVEANVRFDIVVGASVGAINGAYFAARPDSDGVEALAGFWRGLSKTGIFPLSWFDTCRGLIKRRGYLSQARTLMLSDVETSVIPVELRHDSTRYYRNAGKVIPTHELLR